MNSTSVCLSPQVRMLFQFKNFTGFQLIKLQDNNFTRYVSPVLPRALDARPSQYQCQETWGRQDNRQRLN
jgi:hypothetical protein